MEMQIKKKNLWQDDKIQSELQSRFWESFKKNKNYDEFRYKLKTKVSSTFLKNNPDLVD